MILRLVIYFLLLVFSGFSKAQPVYIKSISSPGIDSTSDFLGVNALARTIFVGDSDFDGFAAYIYLVVLSKDGDDAQEQVFRSTACMFSELAEMENLFRKDEVGLFLVRLSQMKDAAPARAGASEWTSIEHDYDYAFANYIYKTHIIPRFRESENTRYGLLFSFEKPIEYQDVRTINKVFWLPFENSEQHVRYIFKELERLSTREKFKIIYGSTGWRFWSDVRSKLAALGRQVSLPVAAATVANETCD